MKLGALKFKAEDFHYVDWTKPQSLAERANQILAERLEKAHQVFGIKDPCELLMVFCAQPREGDTHTARLVCIEESPSVQNKKN